MSHVSKAHPAPMEKLFFQLANTRQMMSLMEKDILGAANTFIYDKTDWVKLWFDPDHAVTSDCGTITAYRAITIQGQLLWYVFGAGKSRGYHATCADPFAAMAEAQDVWARRKYIKTEWAFVETLARDLRLGKRKLEVRIEDAHASPLCTLGIEGFMASVGLKGVRKISGRIAGLLMKIEPQLGFVIFQAWQREQAQQAHTSADSAALSA
ncbi:MAG: hypothetical protein AAF754_01755 [Pseudomonadota bacterium]|mgnify:CR=1 FL=1